MERGPASAQVPGSSRVEGCWRSGFRRGRGDRRGGSSPFQQLSRSLGWGGGWLQPGRWWWRRWKGGSGRCGSGRRSLDLSRYRCLDFGGRLWLKRVVRQLRTGCRQRQEGHKKGDQRQNLDRKRRPLQVVSNPDRKATVLTPRQQADYLGGVVVGHLLYVVHRAAGERAGQDHDACARHAQRGGAEVGRASKAAGDDADRGSSCGFGYDRVVETPRRAAASIGDGVDDGIAIPE